MCIRLAATDSALSTRDARTFWAASFRIYARYSLSFDPRISKAVLFLGRATNPSTNPPFLEDEFVSLSLASLLRPVRLGRPYQGHKVPAGIARRETQVQTKLYQPHWKMDNTRLPKHSLNYKPRGRRDRGRPRKRWQYVDAGRGQTT